MQRESGREEGEEEEEEGLLPAERPTVKGYAGLSALLATAGGGSSGCQLMFSQQCIGKDPTGLGPGPLALAFRAKWCWVLLQSVTAAETGGGGGRIC